MKLPYADGGLYRFEPPLTFPACKAVSPGDAEDCRLTGRKKIVMMLRVNWGHAAAQHLRRVLMDSGGDNAQLITCVDEVLAQRDVFR